MKSEKWKVKTINYIHYSLQNSPYVNPTAILTYYLLLITYYLSRAIAEINAKGKPPHRGSPWEAMKDFAWPGVELAARGVFFLTFLGFAHSGPGYPGSLGLVVYFLSPN